MTYLTLQTRAGVLLSYAGYSNVTPSPDWPLMVNQAWEWFSWEAECVVAIAGSFNTVIGTQSYLLSGGPWKDFLDVSYNGVGVVKSDENYERFSSSAQWRVKANGTPTRWCMTGWGALSLIPPPDAVHGVIVRGVVQGPDMAVNGDLPGQVNGVVPSGYTGVLPAVFHEGIALYAAWLQGKIFAQQEENVRLDAFLQEAQDYADRAFHAFWQGTRRRKESASVEEVAA